MYEIVSENIYYTCEELDRKFDGKWLFLVDPEYDKFHRLVRAKIGVISDKRWGGFQEGIYKKLFQNCHTATRDLLDESEDDWE